MKCFECGKETEKLIEMSDNGNDVESYCSECAGFPNHEYRVTCPNCNIDIAVN